MESTFSKYQLVQKLNQDAGWTYHLAKTSGISGFEKLQVIAISDTPRLDIDAILKIAENEFSRNHNNIVQVLEYGVASELGYISTEYIPGPSLSTMIQSTKDRNNKIARTIPMPVAIFIIGEIIAAIEYLSRTHNNQATSLIDTKDIALSWQGSVKVFGTLTVAHADQREERRASFFQNIAQVVTDFLPYVSSTEEHKNLARDLGEFAESCKTLSNIESVVSSFHSICRKNETFGDSLQLSDYLSDSLPYRDREQDFRWNGSSSSQRESKDDMITHPRIVIARNAEYTWVDSDGRIPITALHIQSDKDNKISQSLREAIADAISKLFGTIHRQNPVSILAVFGLPYPKEIDFNQAVAMGEKAIDLAREHETILRCCIRVGVATFKISRSNALRVSLRGSIAEECAEMATKTPPMSISTSGIASKLGNIDFHLEKIHEKKQFGRKKQIFVLTGSRQHRHRKRYQQQQYQQRQDEVSRVEKSFNTFMKNSRSFVCRVDGSPGIGKSTFLAMILEKVLQENCATLHLEIMPSAINTPMGVGLQIIDRLFDHASIPTSHVLQEANKNLKDNQSRGFQKERPSSDVSKIWTLIKPELPKLFKEKAVLVIDNFQWVDTASIALLSNILGELRKGIFVILAARPTNERSLREYEKLRIKLSPLAKEVLLKAPFLNDQNNNPDKRIAPQMREELVELSGGNPLYFYELTERHRRYGLSLSSENIPPVLYPLLLEELRYVDRNNTGLLRFAALLPTPFNDEMLMAVANRNCTEFLEDAVSQHILRSNAAYYHFQSPLIQQAISQMLLPTTKKRFREHICSTMLDEFADDLSQEQIADLLNDNEQTTEAEAFYQQAIDEHIEKNESHAAKRVLIKLRRSQSGSGESWNKISIENVLKLAQCTMIEGDYDKALSYLSAIDTKELSNNIRRDIRIQEMVILREKEDLTKSYDICRSLRNSNGEFTHVESKGHLVELAATHLAVGQPLRSNALLKRAANTPDRGETTKESKKKAAETFLRLSTLDSIHMSHELYGDGTESTTATIDNIVRSESYLPGISSFNRSYSECRHLFLSGNFHRAISSTETLLQSSVERQYNMTMLAELNIAKSAFRTGCYVLARTKADRVLSCSKDKLFASATQALILRAYIYVTAARKNAALDQIDRAFRFSRQTGRLEYLSLKLAEAKIYWRLKNDAADLPRAFDAASVALAESKKAGILSGAALAAALGAVSSKEMGNEDTTKKLAHIAVLAAENIQLSEYPTEEIYLIASLSLQKIDPEKSWYCITKAMEKSADIRGRIESMKYRKHFDESQIAKDISIQYERVGCSYNARNTASYAIEKAQDPIKI